MARSEAARDGRAFASSRVAVESRLQAEAWLAWLIAASVAVFLTSNPFYLTLACLVGLVVYGSLPQGRRRRAYGVIVKVGLFFALLSIPFNVLTGSSGANSLVTLPRLSFPGWLGGVTLGGQVTAEALVYALGRALRLIALLLFAAAFNVGVDHYRLLRRTPAALRQLGVVATIAVLLLPQALVQGRAIIEAQRLRGRRMRGLKDASAFVVPILAGALERSIQRAESLEARGFGMTASTGLSVRARALTALAIGLAGAGVGLYTYAGTLTGLALIAVAGIAAMLALRSSGGAVETSRYSEEPVGATSGWVIGAALLSLGLLLALRIAGGSGLAYYPYPSVSVPQLQPLAVLAFLLLLAPVPYLMKQGPGESGHD